MEKERSTKETAELQNTERFFVHVSVTLKVYFVPLEELQKKLIPFYLSCMEYIEAD